jgi:hypothetical protein
MLVRGPGDHVHSASLDLVVTTGAAVVLDRLLTRDRPDHPLPVWAALPVRPTGPADHRRWDDTASAAGDVTARHNNPR